MKIKTKLFLSNLTVVIIIILICGFFIFQLKNILNLAEKEIPIAIEELSKNSSLDNLAQTIRYYDEVLTQSARNYAFTGDKKWKERYYLVVSDLDQKIKEAIEKGDNTEKEFFALINDSNLALVTMEEKAFFLVESNKSEEAIKILESTEYQTQKEIYNKGFLEYLNKRGAQSQQVLTISTKTVEDITKKVENSLSKILITFSLSIFGGLVIVLLLLWYFVKIFTKPVYNLQEITKEIIKGNFDKRVMINSDDEFKDLANSFNLMASKLSDLYKGLNEEIEERTKKLEESNKRLIEIDTIIRKNLEASERANELMVDRELKMIELKKEIKELKNK